MDKDLHSNHGKSTGIGPWAEFVIGVVAEHFRVDQSDAYPDTYECSTENFRFLVVCKGINERVKPPPKRGYTLLSHQPNYTQRLLEQIRTEVAEQISNPGNCPVLLAVGNQDIRENEGLSDRFDANPNDNLFGAFDHPVKFAEPHANIEAIWYAETDMVQGSIPREQSFVVYNSQKINPELCVALGLLNLGRDLSGYIDYAQITEAIYPEYEQLAQKIHQFQHSFLDRDSELGTNKLRPGTLGIYNRAGTVGHHLRLWAEKIPNQNFRGIYQFGVQNPSDERKWSEPTDSYE